MSRAAATSLRPVAWRDDADTLDALVDWAGLGRLGWDATREVFAPAADDVLFGFSECATFGCERIAGASGRCRRCAARQRRRSKVPGVEELDGQAAPITVRGDGLCALCCIPGHERPARSGGLCRACVSALGERGQSVAAYLDGDDEFPPAIPRPSFGRCEVAACERWADRGGPALCEWHERAWRGAGRLAGDAFEAWRASASAVDLGSRQAVLRGLGRGVQVELLYGLQCAAEAGRRTPIEEIQRAVERVRTHAALTIVDLPGECFRRLPLLAFARDRVSLALTDPATEAAGDDWDLRVFGRPRGRLHFGRISQSWLKEAAKCWAVERLGTLEHAAQRPNVCRARRSLRGDAV